MIIKCGCGKRLKVPETSAGRIKCGSCGAILKIAPPETEKKDPAVQSAAKPKAGGKKKPAREKSKPASEKQSVSVSKKSSASSPASERKALSAKRAKKRASTRVTDAPLQTSSPGFGAFVWFFFQNLADILRLTRARFMRHRCHLQRLCAVAHGVAESGDAAGQVLSEQEIKNCAKLAGSKGFLQARLHRALLAGLEPENMRVVEEKVLRGRDSVLDPVRRELVDECTSRIQTLAKQEKDIRERRSQAPHFFHSIFMIVWILVLAVFLTALYISGSYFQAIKHRNENIRAGEYIVQATEMICRRNFKGALEEYRKLDRDLIYSDYQQYIQQLKEIAANGIREKAKRQERLKAEKARMEKAQSAIRDLCEKAARLLERNTFAPAGKVLETCPEEYLATEYGKRIAEKKAEVIRRAGEFFAAAVFQADTHESRGESGAALRIYRKMPELGIKKLDDYVKSRVRSLVTAAEEEQKQAVFLQQAEAAWRKLRTEAGKRLSKNEFSAALKLLKTFPDKFTSTVYGKKRLALRADIHRQCLAWYFDVKKQIDGMVSQKKYRDASKMLRQVERAALGGMDEYARAGAEEYAAIAARIEKVRKQTSAVSGAFRSMKKDAQRFMREKNYRQAYKRIQKFEKDYRNAIKNEISNSLDQLKDMLCHWASNDYYSIQSRLELMNKKGSAPVPARPVKKKLKAYVFTFNDPSQIVSWQAESGKWKLNKGKLTQSDFMPSTITLKKIDILPEPVTITFDAVFREKGCEVSLLIGEPDAQPVWSMIFGKGKVAVVSSGILNSKKKNVELNRQYRIAVECGEKSSRLLINDKQVVKEEFRLFRNKVRISLKTLGGSAEFDNIRIQGALIKTDR